MAHSDDESADEVALALLTREFSSSIVIDDPDDHAVVARGRTELPRRELEKVLGPTMRFLGIGADAYSVVAADGEFELRLGRSAVEAAASTESSAKDALQIFLGFGLSGFAVYTLVAPWGGGVLWGVGLLLGGWQLRRGLTSGRAMIAGKLAIALGMLAREDGRLLPLPGTAALGAGEEDASR